MVEYMSWDWLSICHETGWVCAMRLIEYMPWDWMRICHEADWEYAMGLIEYMPWDWLSICHVCHDTGWVYVYMRLIEYMPWDWPYTALAHRALHVSSDWIICTLWSHAACKQRVVVFIEYKFCCLHLKIFGDWHLIGCSAILASHD